MSCGSYFGFASLGANSSQIEIEHATVNDRSHRPSVSYVVQGPGYFETINLPLLMGRDFNENDRTANHKTAIVTRECAQHFWPNQNAIGKRFRFYDDKNKPGEWTTVVVVSANLVQQLDDVNPKPLLFLPYRDRGWSSMALVMRRGLWQITAGLALGMAAAVPAARLIGRLPIGMTPPDPFLFAVAASLLSVVGLFACWLPAYKAATLDPVKAIRYE